jgi:hypothetical protein
MTIRISRSLLNFSFLFGLSLLHYLYIFFEVVFFRFSFPLGFVVACCLYIPWTIGSCLIPYTYIAALLSVLITVIPIVYAICTMPFLDHESASLITIDLDL